MVSFCIKNNNQTVIKYLLGNLSKLDFDDIIFSKRVFSKYTNIIIHYTGENISQFSIELSNIICSCILEYYEPKIIKKLIILNYFYFDYSDIEKIEKNCLELLKNNYLDRKDYLWTDILKYITENKSMVLDRICKI